MRVSDVRLTDRPAQLAMRHRSTFINLSSDTEVKVNSTNVNQRRAFMVFHAVLGGGLVILSHNTLFREMHANGFGHLTYVAALEMVGALLLLIPRTLRVGGFILLAILVPGFIFELAHGDWELDLLIYAAAVWFVMAHGAEWGRPRAVTAG
jgi:hypothetical protein